MDGEIRMREARYQIPRWWGYIYTTGETSGTLTCERSPLSSWVGAGFCLLPYTLYYVMSRPPTAVCRWIIEEVWRRGLACGGGQWRGAGFQLPVRGAVARLQCQKKADCPAGSVANSDSSEFSVLTYDSWRSLNQTRLSKSASIVNFVWTKCETWWVLRKLSSIFSCGLAAPCQPAPGSARFGLGLWGLWCPTNGCEATQSG